MLKKQNYSIFDFDGTISNKSGVIPQENIDFLKSIENKVLNTSRSINEIPSNILNMFEGAMTLNGGQYWEGKELKREFESLSESEINQIVDFASKNKYNIAFDNTKSFFFNVTNESSQEFLSSKNIGWSEKIEVPKKAFQIYVSNPIEVIEPDFNNIHFARQSKRVIEFSKNNKGNISELFVNFTAYGDNSNDIPMFDKATIAFKVEDGKLSEARRIK